MEILSVLMCHTCLHDRMKLLVKAAKQAQRTYFQRILLYRFTSDNSPLSKGLQSTEESGWLCASSREILSAVRGLVEVRQNFISEEEEKALLKELEPGLRKKRYEFDHWDNVSRTYWCFSNMSIIATLI